MHRGVESQIIEEPVYLPVFEKFGRLSLSFDEFERFPRLNVWSVGILERAAVIVGILILRGWIDILLFVIGESQCEIRRIPRHRGFALHVETEIRYRKALGSLSGNRETLYRIPLMSGGDRIESILKQDILIERIVLRCDFLLRCGEIDRGIEFCLLRQEFSEIALHNDIILVVCVETALRKTLIHISEAICFSVH